MNSEIELKFYLRDDSVAQIEPILADFSILQNEVRHLRSVYFDTKQRQLRRWRMGLRIRSGDEQNVQTVKTAGRVVGGLHDRPEYNQVVEGSRPQLSRFENLPWPEEVDLSELENALLPIFVTDFKRTTWLVDLQNETLVEVALDSGKLEVDGREEPICELELELVKGDVGQLFFLGEKLSSLGALILGSTSKAKRGYTLADGLPSEQPIRLGFVPLENDDSLPHALHKSVDYALSHWQRHQQVYIDSLSYRALSELKQAAQLIHQVVSMYQDVVEFSCPWHDDLLWLIRQLGWLDEACHIQGLMDDQGKFIRKLTNKRTIYRQLEQRLSELPDTDEVLQLLSSERYNKLMLALIQWIYQKEDMQAKQSLSLNEFASTALQECWQKLRDSEFGEQLSLDFNQYTRLAGQLKRNLMLGNCLGALFEATSRDEFRSLWLDLLGGIEDLRLLEPIAELADDSVDDKDEAKQLNKWLKRKQDSITDAMEFTRTQALSKADYWLLNNVS